MKTIIHKERLKEALIARKMDPATLAKLAGVGNRTVCRILHAHCRCAHPLQHPVPDRRSAAYIRRLFAKQNRRYNTRCGNAGIPPLLSEQANGQGTESSLQMLPRPSRPAKASRSF